MCAVDLPKGQLRFRPWSQGLATRRDEQLRAHVFTHVFGYINVHIMYIMIEYYVYMRTYIYMYTYILQTTICKEFIF